MKLFSAKGLALVFAWLVTVIGATGFGAVGYKNRAKIRALMSSVQNDPAITTNLHTVRIEKLSVPGEGRDGGIAALGDGILFANRVGAFWFIDGSKTLRPLKLKVPINLAEFQGDPFNANTLYPELFAVKDIALQPIPGGLRLLASHSHWHVKERCNTLRVSSIETTQDKLMVGDTAAHWRTIFETSPCRPLERAGPDQQRMGLGIGGRLIPAPDGGVILSVGGFDPENELALEAAQKTDNSYGKTIWINPETGGSHIYTLGHRNPQGLAVTSAGELWLTEHGARGGDELNLLAESKNYGYPRVAYGTQYDAMAWPLSDQQGRHEGFEKPKFVWTPGIGISQMVVVEKDAFPYWKGDLLVSSLAAQTLHRVRVEDQRVVFVEEINIGHRIRDVVEANNGAIVMKTDDDFIIYLTPLDATTAATPEERGAILAAPCQACHSVTADGGVRIGPSLWKIVGKRVASADAFNYSAGLKALNGSWTPENLHKYLADPNAFVPGTTMLLGTKYTNAQIEDLIAYLQTLK